MGKKIHVVNLNGFEATAPTSLGEQPTNEADEMSKMKEEAENNETEPPTPIEPKAKPKRKSQPKQTATEEIKEEKVEEVVIPPTPKEEVEVKPPEGTEKKVKTVELVSCPDCKKEMSKKTLRYSHEKNCTGKPVVREEIPVKRRAPVKAKPPAETEAPKAKEAYISIPEEIIQQELNKRVKEQREARLRAKDDKIKKLAMNIV
jgi:hypothetical protein